ncbi:methylated-DNA--[protein]-cysteine S-methyltransferase [Candidatus Bathyarchaeota archaeon]|nr:methylated-DNA--[protein]-cysteine S-methyltransferase [Candidatus Bathyarchaeota archaeon]
MSKGRSKVIYFYSKSPIGRIYIASTELGICRASLNPSREDFLQKIEEASGIKPVYEPEAFIPLAEKLESYFRGERVEFRVSFDFLWGTEFQKKVWTILSRIPYGSLTTYGQIASQVGRSKAFRAVGNAVGMNPVFLIIPCHRVIRSDRTLGEFSYGKDIKMKLLKLEGSLNLVRLDSLGYP